MSTEPGEVGQEPERRQRRLWATVAMTTGVAFAVIALLHAPGVSYAIVAVVAGLAYSLVHLYTRRCN